MKYPRTFHLPGSPGLGRDDKRIRSTDRLVVAPVVVLEKLDGSNLALTPTGVFARSHSGPPSHPSFAPAKALWATLAHQLPADATLFGEWCFAVHSIEYPSITSDATFSLFAVRRGSHWDSWADVEALADALGLVTAPLLWSGTFASERELEKVAKTLTGEPSLYGPTREGVVVRRSEGFDDALFDLSVAKWVRADHVQTDDHWSHSSIRRHR